MRFLEKTPCLSAFFLSAMLLTNCSVVENNIPIAAENSNSQKSSGSIPAPFVLSTPVIIPQKMIRRVSIDLTHRLPQYPEIVDFLRQDMGITQLVQFYMEKPEAKKALAEKHQRSWGLLENPLLRLRQIAEQDTSIAAYVADKYIEKIAYEPLHKLRFMIENNYSFKDFFTTHWSIATSDLFSLWGTEKGDAPWLGEDLYVSTPSSDEEYGFLGLSSLMLSFNQQDSTNFSKTYSILNRFICLNLQKEDTHLFKGYTSQQLLDVRKLASTDKNCATCHALYDNVALSQTGLHSGDKWQDWQKMASSAVKGYYGGVSFADTTDLSKLISEDPRTHLCEIKNLVSEVFQRKMERQDLPFLLSLYSQFKENDFNLLHIGRLISASEENLQFVFSDKKIEKPVLRFLQKKHIQAILYDLSSTPDKYVVGSEFEPGIHDIDPENPFNPTDPYFASYKRLVYELAQDIVDQEFVEGRLAHTRKIFQLLPDGEGSTSSAKVITEQINALWFKLTAETIDVQSVQHNKIKDLWDGTVKQYKDKDLGAKKAWRSVLIAVLLSPEFITY